MKKALFILFLVFLSVGQTEFCFAQGRDTDSVSLILKTKPDELKKIQYLIEVAWNFSNYGKMKQGKWALDKCDVLISEEEKKRGAADKDIKFERANFYINSGVYYLKQQQLPPALTYNLKALQLFEELNKPLSQANCYMNLGNLYRSMGDLKKAEKNYTLGLRIQEKAKDLFGKTRNMLNLADIFLQEGEYAKSVSMLKEVISNTYATKDMEVRGTAMMNMGNIYSDTVAIKYGNLPGIKNIKTGLDSAFSLYKNASDIFTETKNIYYQSAMAVNMAGILFEQKKSAEALQFADKAISTGLREGFLEICEQAYLIKSMIYETKHDYKESFAAYQSYIVYRDSLLNEENTRKLVETELNYEFGKKHAADSIRNEESKKAEQIKHDAEVSRQRSYTYFGVGGLLVMIVVTVISIRAYRNKQKASILIEQQKALVEEKQKEILDSIHYAKRIQTALITSEKYIEKSLKRLKRA